MTGAERDAALEGGHSGRRVRVLWLNKGLGPGGAERLLLSFGRLADHERFRFQAAYLLPWKDHLAPALAACGVPSTCLDGPRVGDLRWLRRLVRLVNDERIDVVHFHSPLMASAARPVLRSLPPRTRPVMLGTEHNVWTSHRTPTRWANRATIRLQAATIAVSEEVRSSMPPWLAARSEVLVHGVDVDAIGRRRRERDAARRERGISPDEVVVATVANLRRNKDYPTMLEAAAKLVGAGLPVRFLSVGQGPLLQELVAERDRLGLGRRFEFLGYQEDPIRVLVAADLFCLSSRYEGLPIALLEALAAGLPAAVTAVGAIPSVLRDGQEGAVVSPGDPAALADAVTRLTDPAVRSAQAEAALSRAQSFGMRHAVERQQQLYEELVGL